MKEQNIIDQYEKEMCTVGNNKYKMHKEQQLALFKLLKPTMTTFCSAHSEMLLNT